MDLVLCMAPSGLTSITDTNLHDTMINAMICSIGKREQCQSLKLAELTMFEKAIELYMT